jgi:transcriptional regulator with GAF, ATPase, and Fis domain
VTEQSFRPDLYYRLNVFPIHIPPLRERRDDIPLLVRHAVLRYARKLGKRITAISKDAIDALTAYDWPGNVRELQNAIERGVILSAGSSLELGNWVPKTTAGSAPSPATTLADVERRHVVSVLESTGWRVSGEQGAARVLGLKATTLEARMKKLGIVRPAH